MIKGWLSSRTDRGLDFVEDYLKTTHLKSLPRVPKSCYLSLTRLQFLRLTQTAPILTRARLATTAPPQLPPTAHLETRFPSSPLNRLASHLSRRKLRQTHSGPPQKRQPNRLK